jgi:hypothetical protein
MPVTQWAFAAARWNLIVRAEKSLDIAIAFIIDNNISPWSVGVDYKHQWMDGSKELTKYVKVNGHRAYMAMRPYFDKAVQNLKQKLSCAVVDDICTKYGTGAYSTVTDLIKRYIAHYTLEITIPRMLTFVEGDSLIFIHNADGIKEGTGVYSKPNMEAVRMLTDACRSDYGTTMDAIISELKSDPSLFYVFDEFLKSQSTTTDVAWTEDPCTGAAVGGVGFF